MKKSATPWQDKLHKNQPPEVKEGPESWNLRSGGSRMLIATSQLVYNKVKTIPKGEVMTMGQLREKLAADFDADYTCPLTTGIFFRIAAEAAEEMSADGEAGIALVEGRSGQPSAQQPPARQRFTSGRAAQK